MGSTIERDRPRAVILLGPTGAGKSKLAIEWAETLGGEIISADSVQVYRYMDIGTNKPTPADQRRVRHHLIDLVPPDQPFHAALYRSLGRKKVELVTHIEKGLPEIPLDAAKMRQVLLNLIQNAADAMGEKGGHVTIRAGALARRREVVLAVDDDGPGIGPDDLKHLFEPFFTTKFTGTGLGLTISKSLIEQHGGRIEVDSEVGRGTTFFVFLPESGPPKPAPAAGEAS